MHADIDRVRQFNRFYTRKIGVLTPRYLDSEFSLAEMRSLYEIAIHGQSTASQISEELGIDAGYLSRILRGFEKRGLIVRKSSKDDARRAHLSLTPKGRKTMDREQARTSNEVAKMLAPLPAGERNQLVSSMQRIQSLLGATQPSAAPYTLRPHRHGDMGWVVQRHGALYEPLGYDVTFEALVAEIAAKFIRDFDPACERCWIAERDGENVGSVFVVRISKTVAKLRLLIVEPKARGLGLGRKLVQECIRFARDCSYRKLVLWTESGLDAARAIYESEGFVRIKSEPERRFGRDFVFETWELKL